MSEAVPEFWKRLRRTHDAADIKFTPYSMGPDATRQVMAQIRSSDPALAQVLADKNSGFKTNEAAIVDYASEDDMRRAPQILRQYGLQTHPEMPWIVSMLGQGQIDRGGDIANQLWDKAISSIHTFDDNV